MEHNVAIYRILNDTVTVIEESEGQPVVVTRPTIMGKVATHTIISPYNARNIASYLLGRTNRYRLELIQDIFPQMKAEDREFLITGITPTEWNKMFPKEEQEEEQP